MEDSTRIVDDVGNLVEKTSEYYRLSPEEDFKYLDDRDGGECPGETDNARYKLASGNFAKMLEKVGMTYRVSLW